MILKPKAENCSLWIHAKGNSLGKQWEWIFFWKVEVGAGSSECWMRSLGMGLLFKPRPLLPVVLWILKHFLTCMWRFEEEEARMWTITFYLILPQVLQLLTERNKSTTLQSHNSDHNQILGHVCVVPAVSYVRFTTYHLLFSKCNLSWCFIKWGTVSLKKSF